MRDARRWFPTLSTRLSNGDLVRLSLAGGTAKLTARDRRPWQTPDILQGNNNERTPHRTTDITYTVHFKSYPTEVLFLIIVAACNHVLVGAASENGDHKLHSRHAGLGRISCRSRADSFEQHTEIPVGEKLRIYWRLLLCRIGFWRPP
jgi:hypothetical protein